MTYYLSKSINIPLGKTSLDATALVAKAHALKPTDITDCVLYRQSVDARKKQDVHFVCSYLFSTDKTPLDAKPYTKPQDVVDEAEHTKTDRHVIVVGAGPAGLFCALLLAKSGIKVTIVERGEDVRERKKKVQSFFDGAPLDENSNVQFGLGGAGTFSDGKLTTGISSPLVYTVFNQLVRHGAPSCIMTDGMPHVGTDKLVDVVSNLKQSILDMGGEFLFSSIATDFIVKNGKVVGIKVTNKDDSLDLLGDDVVLACGHSARDTFSALINRGADVVFKPFAVGVRIEHSRLFIDEAQYGKMFATHRDLPTASYKLVYNGRDHSCYSFCMCPGGEVVAATSQKDAVVVNGMSDFGRMGDNSNSAIVVNVTKADVEEYGFGSDALAGVRFQQYLEQKAYAMGGGEYVAPTEYVVDFLNGDKEKERLYPTVTPSYPRQTKTCDLWQLFPKKICETLAEGLRYFDNKIRGFASHGILTAVETRTSSPVKILRDSTTLESNLASLYPTGEGAGYAGGIVSSAVDGLKVAQAIIAKIH